MHEYPTIEDTLAWDKESWSQWLHTRAIGYFNKDHSKITRSMLPFVINTTQNLATQVYDQLMTFAPEATVALGDAAKATVETWAYEDGLDLLCFGISIASLCRGSDIKNMLLLAEEKIGPALSADVADIIYTTVADYAFDRLMPEEIAEYLILLKLRRGAGLPWAFACMAITKVISVDGPKRLYKAVEECLPQLEDTPDIQYLFDIIQERRPIHRWADVMDEGTDSWASKVIGQLKLLALGDDILRFELTDDPESDCENIELIMAERESADKLMRFTASFRDASTYDWAMDVQSDLAFLRHSTQLADRAHKDGE